MEDDRSLEEDELLLQDIMKQAEQGETSFQDDFDVNNNDDDDGSGGSGRKRSESFHEKKQALQRIIMTGNVPLPKKTLNLVTNLDHAVTVNVEEDNNKDEKQEEALAVMEEQERIARHSNAEGGLATTTSTSGGADETGNRPAGHTKNKSMLGTLAARRASVIANLTGKSVTSSTSSTNHQTSESGGLNNGGSAPPGEIEVEEFCKILLLGDAGAGKTSLLYRITDNQYKANPLATAGVDFRIRHLVVDGKKMKVQIWDTAGQEKFRIVTRAYYKAAHGIALVFDITDKDSLSRIVNWMSNIQSIAQKNVSVVLVGNKSDCSASERMVSYEAAVKIADQYRIPYFEASAKTGLNALEIIEAISRDILSSRQATKLMQQQQQAAAAETMPVSSPVREESASPTRSQKAASTANRDASLSGASLKENSKKQTTRRLCNIQ